MGIHDLKTTWNLDTSQVKASCDSAAKGIAGVEANSKKAADAMEAALRRLGDQIEQLAKRRTEIEVKEASTRTEAEKKELSEIVQTERQAYAERGRLLKRHTEVVGGGLDEITAKAAGFGQQMLALGGISLGMGTVAKVVEGLGHAFEEARDYARGLVDEAVRMRESIVELAGITGRSPDLAFTKKAIDFQAATGLTQEGALGFQTEYAKQHGAEVKALGGEDQAAEAEKRVGGLTASMGIRDAAAAAEIAVEIIKKQDYSKDGAAGPANATKDVASIFKTLITIPDFSASVRSMRQVMSQNPNMSAVDAASLLKAEAAGGQKMPGMAAEGALTAIQAGAVDDKNEAAQDLYSKAGLTPEKMRTMGITDVLKQIGAAADEIGKLQGKSREEILQGAFKESAKQVIPLLNFQGTGGFEAAQQAAAAANAGDVEAGVTGAQNDAQGPLLLRRREAQLRAAQFKRAGPGLVLRPNLAEAAGQLTEEGTLGSTAEFQEAVGRNMDPRIALGMLPKADQQKILDRVAANLKRRDPRAHDASLAREDEALVADPNELDNLAKRAGKINAAGGNAGADVDQKILDELKKKNAHDASEAAKRKTGPLPLKVKSGEPTSKR